MRYWTWAEIRTKIEEELDLEDEQFVRQSELLAYANEAIDEAEAEIHTLYEDYFLSTVSIPVVALDESFSIPTYLPNIYGDKIRKIIFVSSDGSSSYPVNRLRKADMFAYKAIADTGTTTDLYQYMIINSTAGAPALTLVPKSRETGTLKVWYLRNANRLTVDADVCDIPEFVQFVMAHMKVKILGKEGNAGYQEALERLEAERARMNAVLAARSPDMENTIECDMSHYEEMV